MKILLLSILSFAMSLSVSAQAPVIAWQKLFSGNEGDYSSKALSTNDGGSLIVGYTEFGGRDIRGYLGTTFAGDILVIKLKANGEMEWQRCLGGQGPDFGVSAIETSDGYMVFGNSATTDCRFPSQNGMDFYLARMSKTGETIWEKRYGGGLHEYGNAMATDHEGNIYLAGNSESSNGDLTTNKGDRDCWVIKVSPSGNKIWQKSFGGPGEDGIKDIHVTPDGSVMVVGYTQQASGDFSGGKGGTDAIAARMSAATGDITWIKLFGGAFYDLFYSILPSVNNSFVIGGTSASKDGDLSGLATHPIGIDAWLININSAGTIQWKKIFAGEFNDHIQVMERAPDGGFVGSGYRSLMPNNTCSYGYNGGLWFFRLSPDGNLLWEKIIPSNYYEGFASIDMANDFSVFIAATANSKDVPGFYGNTSGQNSSVGDIWAIKIHAESLTVPVHPPSFEIDKSSAAVCMGQTATIRTKTLNTGSRPQYRWKRNGIEVPGIYSTTLTASDFKTGEVVSCTISSADNCETVPFSISDQVTIGFKSQSALTTVNIAASTEFICDCSEINFAVTRINGGSNSSFQWLKNGNPVGYNLPEYASSTLKDGDIITCRYSDNDACLAAPGYIVSNVIQMKANDVAQPATISIVSYPQYPCKGNPVTVVAKTTNAGTNPVFEWRKNNQLLALSNDTIVLPDLKATDIITCTLKPDASSPCILSSAVNSNELKINFTSGVTPSVVLETSSDTVCESSPVTIKAMVRDAGPDPQFKWFLNGITAGTNNATLELNSVNDGDQISCRIYPDQSQTCALLDSADALAKTLYLRKPLPVVVNINEIKNNVCQGEPVIFSASHANAGASPEINWYVNNNLLVQNASTLTYTSPKQGELIRFILIPDPGTCQQTEFSSETLTAIVKDTTMLSIQPAETTVRPGTGLQLNTNVSGSVQSFQWSPASQLISANSLNPQTKPLNDETIITLAVLNADGCHSKTSAIIKIEFDFYMPNAFTPNGDGLNDIFRIPRQSRTGVQQFSIYNRWGELVFRTTDVFAGWDGRIKGKAAPAGTYTYFVKGVNSKGPFQKKGSFVLIR
ncbi:gliding motility-associated C-terminal domain-containing protein [Pollutibacter soli]|uniref:gliding motility-associated C-terminal domain-containing protein n=1 Tax=Pollutibacter soli TaxID=3034157 RepID=UPI003013F9A7